MHIVCSRCRWSAGYDGSQIHFVSNTTLLHANGNALRFIDTSGRHVKSLPSQGRGVGPIATAPQAGIIVYAESTLHPRLFVLSYPSCQLEATLEGSGAELEYVSLAMTSSSGKMLASLSGVPDFILTLWYIQVLTIWRITTSVYDIDLFIGLQGFAGGL